MTSGGEIRSAKGKLVEEMISDVIQLSWRNLGGSLKRLSLGDKKTFKVPIQDAYIDKLPEEIREFINSRKHQHFYRAQVDKHVFINGRFVMGIECKAYAENAMLKRILVDFQLLKSLHPSLICCLFQLESMLGGDYSNPLKSPHYGNPSTHTLMSHFPEVTLNIITLLEGDRDINKPIHKPDYYKPLRHVSLERAIDRFSELLSPYL